VKYAVVIEKGEHNYSAYVPDLPGCIVTGETICEIERLIREGIRFHIDGMIEDGLRVPAPSTVCAYVET
jgi:predicted RNase H-like HicB family nuclease